MSTRTFALDPAILARWVSESVLDRRIYNKSELVVQCFRVEELVAEVRRLRGLVECIETVACSEAFRKLSQQGYGDIEELCHKALRSPVNKPPTYRIHALETVCTRCHKASFDCECGEEES